MFGGSNERRDRSRRRSGNSLVFPTLEPPYINIVAYRHIARLNKPGPFRRAGGEGSEMRTELLNELVRSVCGDGKLANAGSALCRTFLFPRAANADRIRFATSFKLDVSTLRLVRRFAGAFDVPGSFYSFAPPTESTSVRYATNVLFNLRRADKKERI